VDSEPAWLPLNGQRYLKDFAVAESISSDVVLVFDAALVPTRSLPRRLWQRSQRRDSGPFRSVVEVADGLDMVLAAGPGSSTASVTMELLAAHGVARVISIGSAAATSMATGDGDVCLISEAVLASAVSPYGQAGERSGPLFDWLKSRVDAIAPALTTLWPFRVDASDVLNLPEAIIEMEAATLHAVGRHHGIVVDSLVVISDRYEAGDWRLGDAARASQGLQRAVDIAIAAMNATR
jgi:hypothetical protein